MGSYSLFNVQQIFQSIIQFEVNESWMYLKSLNSSTNENIVISEYLKGVSIHLRAQLFFFVFRTYTWCSLVHLYKYINALYLIICYLRTPQWTIYSLYNAIFVVFCTSLCTFVLVGTLFAFRTVTSYNMHTHFLKQKRLLSWQWMQTFHLRNRFLYQ